jgi:ABC-type transport system involved in multi-copper enzyme maturation permease subunit
MLTNIRYILLTALRDWLFIGLFIGVLVATWISAVLGGTAFLEEQEMTITFASGAARIILMIGLIVFVCFHIRSAFDTKEIDVILSRPISRASLVVAYWLGFSLVSLLLTVPLAIILGFIGVISWGSYAGWAMSLLLEGGLVVALALFSAFTLRSAVASVLGCMGFYVLSRMMEFFVLTAEGGIGQGKEYVFFHYALKFISMIVPRLDLFTKSEWLVYGFTTSQEWMVVIAQTTIFVPMLLLATIADFRRKQF